MRPLPTTGPSAHRAHPWARVAAITTTIGLLAGCTSGVTPEDVQPVAQDPGSGLLDDAVVHDIDIAFDQNAYDAMIETFTSTGDKEWITATLTIDGQVFHDVGLRLKGNSSLSGLRGNTAEGGARPDDEGGNTTGDQGRVGGAGGGPGGGATAEEPESLPWLVRLDENREGQSYDGLTEFVIRSNSSATSLNEAVALALVGLAGLATQEAASTRLTVNGSEEQLRLVVENPGDEWEDRVFATEGVLYKAEAGGDYSYRGDDPSAYEEIFDQESGDQDDLTPLLAFLEFINDADDETFAAELGNHLDVAAFADYLALQELIGNEDDIDGPGNNSYLRYDAETSRFTVVTWDLNLAFGGLGGGLAGGNLGTGQRPDGDRPPRTGELPEGFEPPADGDGTQPPRADGAGAPGGGGFGVRGGSNILVERFLANSAFAEQYEASIAELRAALYESGEAEAVLDRWSTLLAQDAADLVDADVVAEEASAIASYFAAQSTEGDGQTAAGDG